MYIPSDGGYPGGVVEGCSPVSTGPLTGIKVVELAEGTTGSYCGKLFADLGADVIKVERPEGDPLRRQGAKGEIGGNRW